MYKLGIGLEIEYRCYALISWRILLTRYLCTIRLLQCEYPISLHIGFCDEARRPGVHMRQGYATSNDKHLRVTSIGLIIHQYC